MTTTARTYPVGTATGTLAVHVGTTRLGTCYPVHLPGQVHTAAGRPVAWAAYRAGRYLGHERTKAAAVRAIVAAR